LYESEYHPTDERAVDIAVLIPYVDPWLLNDITNGSNPNCGGSLLDDL